MRLAAYIPCCNNAATIEKAIFSLQAQTLSPEKILVVDDASIDCSDQIAEGAGARVIRHFVNTGRGGVRARAMEELQADFILCCDATNILPPDFAELAIEWFKQPEIAAVCSRISQQPARTTADRWRSRHLFRLNQPLGLPTTTPLFVTYGAMVRRSAVLAVGNFDPNLRHTEDRALGEKLLAAGQKIMYDPRLETISIVSNSLPQVLERYIRWHAGATPKFSFKHYVQQVLYSIKVMSMEDLRDGDLGSVLISLLVPHYESWWLLQQKQKGSRN